MIEFPVALIKDHGGFPVAMLNSYARLVNILIKQRKTVVNGCHQGIGLLVQDKRAFKSILMTVLACADVFMNPIEIIAGLAGAVGGLVSRVKLIIPMFFVMAVFRIDQQIFGVPAG